MGRIKGRKNKPAGIKVKSAILFSIFFIILSLPLLRKAPELVRSLNTKWVCKHKACHIWSASGNRNKKDEIYIKHWTQRKKKSNPRSTLFPVSLSITADLCILGLAILIRCSHSSFVCSNQAA